MKVFFTLLFVWLLGSTALWGQPADVVWNSQSRNSSGSMPCGGGDIGMNVWVEDDDVFVSGLPPIRLPAGVISARRFI